MSRYVIFVISSVLCTLGTLASADDRQRQSVNVQGEPVFVDVVVKNLNNEPFDVEFGPCSWKVSGELVSNSSVGRVIRPQLGSNVQRDNGYRMGLVCQETRQKELEVKFGLARNVSGAQLFKTDNQVFIEPINETSVYLTFTKKWGGNRP